MKTKHSLWAEGIKKIAAFGKTSYEVITVGIGSADVTTYHIELVEGLENGGYAVDESFAGRLPELYRRKQS